MPLPNVCCAAACGGVATPRSDEDADAVNVDRCDGDHIGVVVTATLSQRSAVMGRAPNATLIRKGYAGFATSDMTTLLAEDVVWTVASPEPCWQGLSPARRTCSGSSSQVSGNAAAEACRSRSKP
jgi:hypothetical protein